MTKYAIFYMPTVFSFCLDSGCRAISRRVSGELHMPEGRPPAGHNPVVNIGDAEHAGPRHQVLS